MINNIIILLLFGLFLFGCKNQPDKQKNLYGGYGKKKGIIGFHLYQSFKWYICLD